MNYKIFENGELINTIVADESFVTAYCQENGSTYELVEETQSPSAVAPVPGGFYVGSGSYGQDFPTVFHAKENAEMLVIQDGGRGETKVVFPAADELKDSTGASLCQVAVEGTTVKLWSEESAEKQFNRAGALYHYYSV